MGSHLEEGGGTTSCQCRIHKAAQFHLISLLSNDDWEDINLHAELSVILHTSSGENQNRGIAQRPIRSCLTNTPLPGNPLMLKSPCVKQNWGLTSLSGLISRPVWGKCRENFGSVKFHTMASAAPDLWRISLSSASMNFFRRNYNLSSPSPNAVSEILDNSRPSHHIGTALSCLFI